MIRDKMNKLKLIIVLYCYKLRMVNNEIRFELTPSSSKNVTQLTTVKYDLNIEGSWHKVHLNYTRGLLTLNVDDNNKTAFLNGIKHFLADQTITIGSGIGGKGSFGTYCYNHNIPNGKESSLSVSFPRQKYSTL